MASATSWPAKPGPRIVPIDECLGGGPAKCDLVKFLALLVEAEDADVADMMVATGVDAARDIDLDLTDLFLAADVGELARDRLGHGDRTCCRQRAVVEARAGDDVAGKAIVRRSQTGRLECLPDGEDIILLHMRKHDVLRMTHA